MNLVKNLEKACQVQKKILVFGLGISVVAHMKNPKIAAAHFNTRYISTKGKQWFGGGCDLTPAIPEKIETTNFHEGLERTCNQHDEGYYNNLINLSLPKLDAFEKDSSFIKDTGQYFINFLIDNTKRKKDFEFDQNDLITLSKKRSRYVEFNLLYDRGTLFGLKTGGNIDAILMSMPPNASWD